MSNYSYSYFKEYFGKKADRPLANHTRIVNNQTNLAVRFWYTDVVQFFLDGRIILNSGGFRTQTTKERISTYSGYPIIQEKGVWFIDGLPFKDGMVIKSNGKMTGCGSNGTPKKLAKLVKEINQFASIYMEKLLAGEIPEPSAGDCWYCVMVTTEGKTLGDVANSSHLLEHLRQHYYVPSLVVNAVKEHGSMADQQALHAIWVAKEFDSFWVSVFKSNGKRSLVRYFKKQLDIAS